MLVRSWEAR